MNASSPTEQRNPSTHDIDVVSSLEAVRLVIAEDALAAQVTLDAAAAIAALADLVHDRLSRGGRWHTFGAGASGRIAVLDATELTPTFGVSTGRVVAHFPGGTAALVDSSIDLEDGKGLGSTHAAEVGATDIALGITVSGVTPYVEGALRTARDRGAATALITGNPHSPLIGLVDVAVILDTGPEALTGSTRLKAGTATKIALNAISTVVMIRLGRTYSNLMVGMTVTNDKLRERAVGILVEATGCDPEASRAALNRAGNRVPHALVALLGGVSAEEAAAAMQNRSSVREALSALSNSR
jgi:N-acetylmuramic acid 6-phosphate etherase